MTDLAVTDPDLQTVFVLSFRHRDALASKLVDGGFRAVAARRTADAARRLTSSNAAVALIDTRGAIDAGVEATELLAPVARSLGRALVTIVDRDDAMRLPDLRHAGATHFLSAPMHDVELVEAIRFAERRAPRGLASAAPTSRRAPSVASLARELPAALERDEVELLFQPQVRFADDRIVGVEALARWRHPKFGEVGAELLLAAADRGGLGQPLARRIQERAFRVAAAWPPSLARLRLSVNLTADDLAESAMVDQLLARIDASGLARDRLTLEVTEGALIEELGAAAAMIGRLRDAGCRIAIDDFGTGYSSLAYLNVLPLDYLKLDKRMTRDITGTPRQRVVVSGVIDMAQSLGLQVIAEGVETEAQRDRLAAQGCALYQGYLCAPPIDSTALAALVSRQAT
jgi:EAL domain-containing protein (putative c-di-GMP-specific phosphodiesterase class I)